MVIVFAIALALVGVVAGSALWAMRRAVAAGLIGEIADAMNLMETHLMETHLTETHGVESALAKGSDSASLSPLLPALSTLVYRSDAAWLALLGPHLARLVASFYAAAATLHDELLGLVAETSDARRAQRAKFAAMELERAFDLGEEALRGLRPIASGRRPLSISRA